MHCPEPPPEPSGCRTSDSASQLATSDTCVKFPKTSATSSTSPEPSEYRTCHVGHVRLISKELGDKFSTIFPRAFARALRTTRAPRSSRKRARASRPPGAQCMFHFDQNHGTLKRPLTCKRAAQTQCTKAAQSPSSVESLWHRGTAARKPLEEEGKHGKPPILFLPSHCAAVRSVEDSPIMMRGGL